MPHPTHDPLLDRIESSRRFFADADYSGGWRAALDSASEFPELGIRNVLVQRKAEMSKLHRRVQLVGETADDRALEARLLLDALRCLDELEHHILTRFRGTAESTSPGTRPAVAGPEDPKPTGVDEGFEAARDQFIRRKYATTETNVVFRCERMVRSFGSFSRAWSTPPATFRLDAGTITGVVGPNSSGKSTILSMVANKLAATGGRVSYPGLKAPRPGPELAWYCAYVPQQPQSWTGTLREGVVWAAATRGIVGTENENEVEFILERLDLTQWASSRWSEVSGGVCSRFSIAAAIVWRPRLLVLDEPMAPLDLRSRLQLLEDLGGLARSRRRPMAVILSGHEVSEIESLADQVLVVARPECLVVERDGAGLTFGDALYEVRARAGADVVVKAVAAAGARILRHSAGGGKVLLWTAERWGLARVCLALQEDGVPFDAVRDLSASTERVILEGVVPPSAHKGEAGASVR